MKLFASNQVPKSSKLSSILNNPIQIYLILIFFIFILINQNVGATPEDDAIGKWAEQIGDELWDLGKRMTKSPEIKAKYKEYNARVEKKDGESLIRSILKNVSRMLARKIDAIRCILNKAENVSINFEFNRTYAEEEFQYYSSKYSEFNSQPTTNISMFPTLQDYAYMYKDLDLNEDSHFFNLYVNTNYSSVHVPANIFDRSPDVLRTIMWSEELDDVFVQNYKTDPALSWQYFCSDTGILRHYPALQWDIDDTIEETEADTYDCRKRSWYIETATCSKDIVILMDNSGSMRGFRNHIAKFTINEIMNTFSNNDFFTIFNYSKTTDDIIPCFKDNLVQATPENIKVFYEAISELEPEGYANLTIAFPRAFELLRKYYIERGCNESQVGCNQAIMLVTDGIPSNFTEIYQQYNWDSPDNSTKGMKVRIFTYLLGKEVTKVREIQWMACLNRGYYSHVQTLDEVQGEVLKYVDVIATPLVLQNEEHPPTWTHAFADRTYKPQSDGDEDVQNDEAPRLLIAVGIPAFNRDYLQENSTANQARLLGVAGTDIPVEDIDRITLPYKLGVNGYSFVISNNGYVLLHPDLRPSYIHEDEYDLDHPKQKRLKVNYNSIDLVEIEQINDDFDDDPREINEQLLEIRRNMVQSQTGKNLNVQIKFHYDKMRRVSEEEQDYFYAPIPETPFSLGLVLPSKYGKTWIKVGEESKMNINKGINIADYFLGENWKIHPDWVYCKYHYLEGHEFEKPEDELKHFLGKIMDSETWEWHEQYEQDDDSEEDEDEDEGDCGRKSLDDDAYYCNKELVELLIFDAKVTNSSYGAWEFTDEKERALIKMYNATLRFVATMSGLTRWQFIFGEVEVKGDKEFGDYHTTAIDETWYKSAILQHAIDPDSFVYSVPHASDPEEDSELKVTSSHAIFPRDGGLEAPGSVVGFQFSHSLMYQRFATITSKVDCGNCTKTCATDDHECFVIDNNGYIILSENVNDTGKFFGDVEGAVMEAMVDFGIYKEVIVYDFQAVCKEVTQQSSDCSTILTPIQVIGSIINVLVTELMWYWARLNYYVQAIPFYDEESNQDYDEIIQHSPKQKKHYDEDGEEEYIKPKQPIVEYRSCDKESHLYILQQQDLFDNIKYNAALEKNYSRPFHIKRIPKSNLLLVVVKMLYNKEPRRPSTEPKEILYDIPFPCYKLNLSFLERRRLTECYTHHENEEQFTYCGRGNHQKINQSLTILSTIIIIVLTMFWQR
ncbi:voltage-dependent calcium channel subunit alpha-2/delta-3 [Condylostylus longicornis]|uniref:voltage-dependent calcium channel subunit alpha-2/delta-3 n=1 Tax=Condylostylus longicornis TaxID=2530218 RepID=UPI00244E10B6|nr:voltage-dependent calcium channel subunit alpha-2/delta-3 [Condylostylus longicornis]XP_055387227.1 voltage-dependent calcium channel subunit alpha-2/delta-3 [Condylostylus longicornis]